jgi:hypothetical protein
MSIVRIRAIGTLIVVAALGVGACGGSSNNSGSGDKSTGSTQDLSKITTGNSQFDALLQKARTAKYKATYSNTDGSSYTIVNDPPKAAFINGTTAMYQGSDGKTVSCSGTGATAQCMEVPGGTGLITMIQSALGPWAMLLQNIPSGLFVDVQTTNKTIAGRDATCTTIDASKLVPGQTGSLEGCFDSALGIFLSGTTTSGSTTSSITATDVSTSVTDADTTPPAKATATPSYTIPSYTVPST